MLDSFWQILNRIQSYPWWVVAIELAVIWVAVYLVMRFLRGTRGAGVIKGAAFILIVFAAFFFVPGQRNRFERLNFLYSNFLTFSALALVIVFQPELRRGLVRLGEGLPVLRGGGLRKARVIEEVISAVAYLSKNKIGALIAIERQVGLVGIEEAGTRIDAVVTKELLNTIFWPGSALHDMGVIIRGDRIVSAGVQFPLAEGEQFSSELGSRHRAAIGLSQEADALIIAVSEETGTISIAERGQLTRNLTVETLRTQLVRGLGETAIDDSNDDRRTRDEDTGLAGRKTDA